MTRTSVTVIQTNILRKPTTDSAIADTSRSASHNGPSARIIHVYNVRCVKLPTYSRKTPQNLRWSAVVYTLQPIAARALTRHHSLDGSSDSVNGDLQFLWG